MATVSLTGSDVRPRGGNPAFCDLPAHDDILLTLRVLCPITPLGRSISDIVIANTADEYDEGELADPTRDNGTESLDAIALWKRKLDLTVGRDGFGTTALGAGTYTYSISPSTKYVTKAGTWTTQAAIDLAYQNEEQDSSTAASTLTLVRTGTAFAITGYQFNTQGQFTVTVDGGAATTVDSGSGSGGRSTVLWSVTGLSNASHTIVVTVLGSHSAGSTNDVRIDRFKVTYVPG